MDTPDALSRLQRDLRVLKTYIAVITVLGLLPWLLVLRRSTVKERVGEISAERINIIEKDGSPRLVLANKDRSPAPLWHGRPFGIPGQDRPGLIFYNDEGTEDGGLVFAGKSDTQNGQYKAFGHLSFDQYNQNQVLYLQYSDENGRRKVGLHVDDWHDAPPFAEWRAQIAKAHALPDGAEKDARLKQLMEPHPGDPAFASRVFIGRDEDKTAAVVLSDAEGRPRLRPLVDAIGKAKLDFLDENGRVTYSVSAPQAK
jgi:hypothetical protein